MNFQPADRLPMIEWAPWWDKTIERWHGEGMPPETKGDTTIRTYFGLDIYEQCWIRPTGEGCPEPERHGAPLVNNAGEYEKFKQYLYPENAFDKEEIRTWAQQQARGEIVVWITFNGFFWYPRTLFGIEQHLYAFYDQADLMHRMNQDLLDYHLRVLDEFCAICTPDFMTFAEDMSYNNGPMVSRQLFDDFMAPYYRKIVPKLAEREIIPIIDSDGEVKDLVPWFAEVGVDAFLPLERQAGFDIAAVREKHPKTRFIGGYDKMVMSKDEAEMRAEFERLLPVMKQGGYIPSCDHQTPPGVSLTNYKIYLKLLHEYCIKAMNR
jgi:hypothetical protein